MLHENSQSLTDHPKKETSRFFGQRLVKQGFQIKFSLFIFACMIGMYLLMLTQGHMAIKHMIDTGLLKNEDIHLPMQLMQGVLLKSIILGLALTFGLSLFFSHFIAGPLYRFEKMLEEMGSGNLAITMNLRKYDELKEVAVKFNDSLKNLRSKIQSDRDSLNARVDEFQTLAEKMKKNHLVKEAAEIEVLVFEIRHLPSTIKI